VRDELSVAAQALGLTPRAITDICEHLPDMSDIHAARGRLFGHTVRSTCPPYELEYGGGEVFQQSQMLADLAGFYRAFGFDAVGPLAERPDHFVAEWEFMSVLAAKEAYQLAAGCDEGVSACRDGQRAFLKSHAASWMPAFFARIRRTAPATHYSLAVDVAEALLREWCAAYDVALGPAWLELRPTTEDDSTVSCGAPDLAQVELGPVLAAGLEARR